MTTSKATSRVIHAGLINLFRNRKSIWEAMKTISEVEFEPHHSGWHHWSFQQGVIYKDGEVAPDDIIFSMWVKNPADTTKYKRSSYENKLEHPNLSQKKGIK